MPVTGKAPVTAASPTNDDADRRGVSVPVDAELAASTASAVGQSVETPGTAPVALHVAKDTGKRHGLAQVTGIRHWSTPTYTRVAIDFGDYVTYEAARVPGPDRIYFDLHGTRLASELVGKSFAVTDDGFLKKIRAAQFSNDMTRVVLDVSDVTEYSAFLLPSPYRLIIDIHGGGKEQAATTVIDPSAGLADAPAPRVAAVVKATAAKPVPNTVSSKSVSTNEIASLSAEPGKVDATSVPTSQPISAKVQVQEQGLGIREQGLESQGLGIREQGLGVSA